MTTEVQLPELGENIEEAEVLKVLVAEGDEIQEGQDVVELETDKATVGLPSPAAGRVKQIAVKQGDHVHVGATVLTLEGGAAEPAREAPSPRQKSPPPADTRERTAAPSTQTARGNSGARLNRSVSRKRHVSRKRRVNRRRRVSRKRRVNRRRRGNRRRRRAPRRQRKASRERRSRRPRRASSPASSASTSPIFTERDRAAASPPRTSKHTSGAW